MELLMNFKKKREKWKKKKIERFNTSLKGARWHCGVGVSLARQQGVPALLILVAVPRSVWSMESVVWPLSVCTTGVSGPTCASWKGQKIILRGVFYGIKSNICHTWIARSNKGNKPWEKLHHMTSHFDTPSPSRLPHLTCSSFLSDETCRVPLAEPVMSTGEDTDLFGSSELKPKETGPDDL